jgi:hypothetical protein
MQATLAEVAIVVFVEMVNCPYVWHHATKAYKSVEK